MRLINKIIVHCSATPPTMDIGVAEIRKWHVAKGWRDVGYHYVIRRNGEIELGRDEAVAGAHTQGHNAKSIGVCMVGGINKSGAAENNFTGEQFDTLDTWLRSLKADYPLATVHGHREFANKDCPSFDIHKWMKERDIV